MDLFLGTRENESGLRKLIVEVSDDGIGIPEESHTKIFTRFYRAENTREEHTGTGIGLSLVHSLVKVHKSEIKLSSTPGKGSVFTLGIPVDKAFYDESEILDFENSAAGYLLPFIPEVKKNNHSTDLKEKVVVIEDNQELRNYIADCISDSYKVYTAENGEEGLQICRNIKPIICVADVMMPVMDGFEFCKTLKNDERISHIPVILLTALSDIENQIRGYKQGADGYLTKPFDPSLLKTRIQNIVKARADLKKTFSGDVESSVNVLTHSPVDEEFLKN